METLETIVEELKLLSQEKLQEAAHYVHDLTEKEWQVRKAALQKASGSLKKEIANAMQEGIESACEQIDAN